MSNIVNKNTDESNQQAMASSVEAPSYTQKQTFGQLLRGDLGFLPVFLTLLIIVVYFTATPPAGIFLQPRNFSNLLQQSVQTGITALGVVPVLLLAEVDLSLAVVGTFGAVVMGILSERMGVPATAAIAAGILAGALAGAINGFFIAVLRIPSFIVTLAAYIFYQGAVLSLLAPQDTLIIHNPTIVNIAGSSTSFLPDWLGIGLPIVLLIVYAVSVFYDQTIRKRNGLRTKSMPQLVGRIVLVAAIVLGVVFTLENTPSPTPGLYLGVPTGVAIFMILILIVWLVLTKTTYGRHIYAAGGNAEAARRAGINITMIRITVFTLCSGLAAVAGVIQASRANSVATAISPVLTLQAIAAAVIGGVSLFGGKGSAWAIILGTLIITSLANGLSLQSRGTDVQFMIQGAVLLLAVTADALIRRAQARSGR
ncbi:ABC transporter permease [Reticulibacter mediterranei]|uniref:Xylose transport system permease protein XylH n=1 Tax=Reticulibacter mediterranei TaxID=2778369 RepID=A0A8J3N4Y7_9CHLR|nr:inner-membrane translocator [Reticulibacter mediterranei]GHO95948.1 ABC transporter permease [Reticulibacter mediterranei]